MYFFFRNESLAEVSTSNSNYLTMTDGIHQIPSNHLEHHNDQLAKPLTLWPSSFVPSSQLLQGQLRPIETHENEMFSFWRQEA